MDIKIVESHIECGVDVGKILKRILKYVPPESIEGLKMINTENNTTLNKAFSSYDKNEKKITLYIDSILSFLPNIFIKSYLLPYFFIATELGIGIDFHYNRKKEWNFKDRKRHAEKNGLNHVYLSFGIFKPVVRMIQLIT